MAHRDSAHFFVLGRETFLDKVFNTTTDTTPKKKNQSMRSTDNDPRYRRDGKYYIFSFGRRR